MHHPGVCWLWLSSCNPCPQASRLDRQPQANAAHHARRMPPVPVKAARMSQTTDSQHPYQIYPNLVKGLTIEALDVVWVVDLTYIRLPSAFAYLAAILDAYSRKCVGWKLSRQIATQ